MSQLRHGIYFCIVVIACFISAGIFEARAEDSEPAGQAQVTSDSLEVHSRTSITSGVVKNLKQGDTVTVQFELEKDDNTWCAISEGGQAEIEGYVICDSLKREEKKRAWEYVGSSGDTRQVRSETNLTFIGNHVLVPVTLQYKDRDARGLFLLDTGASSTVIRKEMADKLGVELDKALSVKAMVLGGGTVEVKVIQLSQLEVGPHRIPDMIVGVFEQKGQDVAFDGVLGMDFLGSVKYEMDLRYGVIRWK